ncbi:MAG: ArsB/NhaD family transporter [Lachnospiraceae bacterium]|nr:ArsB/NhaD family transporter [Lachnospiraceae bacterium]
MHSPSAIMETLNLRNIFTIEFWHTSEKTSESPSETNAEEKSKFSNERNTEDTTESSSEDASVESTESSSGINWATIIFIAGMMIMVEGMARVGFFRWLCMRIANLVHYETIPIFITFMIMSALLAMFIDSITVILFLAAVTVELAQLLKFNPVPMILAEIFCANLGGSATMCGDPPNIIIGTSLGYSFFDFILNTGVIAGISLIIVIVYFYFVFRKELIQSSGSKISSDQYPNPKDAITDKKGFVISTIIFLCAVVLLVTHAQTGLTVAFIGLFIALATLLTSIKYVKEILSKVDYKTLLFFVGLFIVVGGLEQTGILEVIANFIGKISNGNIKLMIAIIIWVSAIASAFVDNIPFAATMIPIIKGLSAAPGVNLSVLAWALSMGTDIGGSATPIGASANVVGTSVAAKSGHPIGWGEYCKKVAPATVLVLLIATICIFVRYC